MLMFPVSGKPPDSSFPETNRSLGSSFRCILQSLFHNLVSDFSSEHSK